MEEMCESGVPFRRVLHRFWFTPLLTASMYGLWFIWPAKTTLHVHIKHNVYDIKRHDRSRLRQKRATSVHPLRQRKLSTRQIYRKPSCNSLAWPGFGGVEGVNMPPVWRNAEIQQEYWQGIPRFPTPASTPMVETGREAAAVCFTCIFMSIAMQKRP